MRLLERPIATAKLVGGRLSLDFVNTVSGRAGDGSVAGDRLTHLVQAGEGLAAALRPADKAALITFSHVIDLRVPMTGDRQPIRQALATMRGTGATSLRDAIHLALQLQPHDQTRPLVAYYERWAASGEAGAPKYRKINGTGEVDEITARALAALA